MKPHAIACLVCIAFDAVAGDFYKWKDPQGVTQYSEKKPDNQKYQQLRSVEPIRTKPAGNPDDSQASPECLNARRNLDILNSGNKAMLDGGDDGKTAIPLDDSQRDAQRSLAEASIKANCFAHTRP